MFQVRQFGSFIDGNSDKDCYFLGAVEDNESQTKWSVDLSLGKTQMRFKIDTGADVTVIPEPLYLQTGINNLTTTVWARASQNFL